MHKLFKISHSRALYAAGITAGALLVLVPQTSQAASTTTTTSLLSRGVCLRLSELEGDFIEKIHEANLSYAKVAKERMEKIAAQASRRDSEEAAARKDADKRLSLYASDLLQKVNGDTEKKTAVAAFVKEINEASTARRLAVAAAQNAFTASFKALATIRDKEVETQSLALTGDIQAALLRAQISCAAGTDPKSVRATLHSDLSSLDITYRASFADRTHLFEGLQGITDTRRAAINAANDAFAARLNKASQTLHSVL